MLELELTARTAQRVRQFVCASSLRFCHRRLASLVCTCAPRPPGRAPLQHALSGHGITPVLVEPGTANMNSSACAHELATLRSALAEEAAARRALEARVSELAAELAALRSHVHCEPEPTLLTSLPVHLAAAVLSQLPVRERARLAAVCRAWRLLVTTQPSVWSTIDLRSKLNHTVLSLRRSWALRRAHKAACASFA